MQQQQVDVRALATDRWPEILEEAGIGDDFLQNKHGPCPACGGKDRFRFDNKDGRGTYFCSGCGAGDGFSLLEKVHGWSFKESANFIREFFGGTTTTLTVVPPKKAPVDDKEEKAKIRRTLIWTWKGAKAVTPGDPVWKYLVQTRKLPLTKVPSSIRFHPGLKYFDEDKKEVGTFPVMLTVVRDATGKAVGLHRTYLTSDGRKAPVNEPKKTHENLRAAWWCDSSVKGWPQVGHCRRNRNRVCSHGDHQVALLGSRERHVDAEYGDPPGSRGGHHLCR